MLSKSVFVVASVAMLGACAGTAVRKETADNVAPAGMLKVSGVKSKVSAKASEQLPDNIKFDLGTLNATIERTLSASNLQDSAAATTLDVEVTSVYIRGTFSAVMFGIFAGPDNISGNVRVLDAAGKPLRTFEISSSYAFGGFAGGQDSIRLNYLYEKFAELTRDQLRDQK